MMISLGTVNPWWHDPVLSYANNLLCTLVDLIIVSKSEWSDLSFTVTVETAGLNDRCSVTGVADRRLLVDFGRHLEQATNWRGFCNDNWFAFDR